MNDWKVVFKSTQIIDAEIIRSMLLDAGIEAVIINRIDRSLKFGEASVYCMPADFEEAEEIIKSNPQTNE